MLLADLLYIYIYCLGSIIIIAAAGGPVGMHIYFEVPGNVLFIIYCGWCCCVWCVVGVF